MLSVIAYEATRNYKLYPGSILQIGESQELWRLWIMNYPNGGYCWIYHKPVVDIP